MSILRVVENNLSAGATQTYDLRAMGATGCIYTSSRDEGSNFAISAKPVTGGLSQLAMQYKPAAGGGVDDGVQVGIPLNYATADFVWTGAGTRHNRIVFVNDPVIAFGRVPVRCTTQTLAALATANLLVAYGLGVCRKFQLLVQGDRAFHTNLTAIYLNGSIVMNNFTSIAAAGGGFQVSAEIPAPRAVSLDITNDDAVALLTYTVGAFGFFN